MKTSVEVYHQIVAEGLVNRLQERVLEMCAKASEPLTMGEIAQLIGITQRNTVDPRGPELLKLGALMVAGKRPCRVSGRTVNTYALSGQMPKRYVKPETRAQIITRLTKENESLKNLLAAQDEKLAAMRQVCPS